MGKQIATALGATSKAVGHFEGNGLIVAWCVGHLTAPKDAVDYDPKFKRWHYEDLPIIPKPFRYNLLPGKDAVYAHLHELMHRPDVDVVINACDAGREGELIFRLVYEMAGCRKPVQRMWLSSMEPAAVREAYANLRPGSDYDRLYHSALCRQQADWLVGINASRLFSVLYHRNLAVGRVQTPTLKLLVDRDSAISGFQKEPYYHVRLKLDDMEVVSDKFGTQAEADTIMSVCKGNPVICTAVHTEVKNEAPPKLYDLTTLQRDANRRLGYTAKQTLEYAQALYEKQLLTYPRTDSRYLPSDMAETVNMVLHIAAKLPVFRDCDNFYPDVSAMIADDKVTDHHAIIPTAALETADIPMLPVGERNLLLLICCNLLCAVAERHTYEMTTLHFDCAGHPFTAKGKRIVSMGWRDIDRQFSETIREKKMDEVPALPIVVEGQVFYSATEEVTEHFTKPPKAYTEDTLLAAIERNGLGTPATRAAIIEKLIHNNFVERKGKSLLPTHDGVALVTVLPEVLTSPELTAQWEQQLAEIAQGIGNAYTFMHSIEAMVQELVQRYSQVIGEEQNPFDSTRESLGSCPRCGKPVYENRKNYACSDRSCGFVLWKNDHFWRNKKVVLTKAIATELLQSGRVYINSLWSMQRKKTYDATVVLDDTPEGVKYRLEFKK